MKLNCSLLGSLSTPSVLPCLAEPKLGVVHDVCTAVHILFVLTGLDLVYVSWAVVNQIAAWGGGHSQMFSIQGELQEKRLHSLLMHVNCQPGFLLCQPSPLG